ncbi:MAG: uroporphyrinogen decarboxylase family protein [Candidatus Aminicenantales bacterium]
MTGYERIMAAFRGEPADRIPIMLHNFLMAAREGGVSMARFRRDGKVVAESFIKAVEKYDYDGIVVDISTTSLAGALGVPVDLPEDMPARTKGPLLTSLEMVADLPEPDVSSYFEVQTLLEAVSRLKAHFRNEVAIRGNCDQCPFSLAASIRGIENWMIDLAEADPKKVQALLTYCGRATKQMLQLMAAAGADILSNGDSPAGPEVIAPAMYRKFALPYEKEVAALAHELERPYILHICGNTSRILEDMMDSGADGLELDFKTDEQLARRILGGKVVFVGNIDPSGVLTLGTPAVVEQKTIELLEIWAGEPRFILNAGCAIPAETPAENLQAMVRAARSFEPLGSSI